MECSRSNLAWNNADGVCAGDLNREGDAGAIIKGNMAK
jgi:hypothetical protein